MQNFLKYSSLVIAIVVIYPWTAANASVVITGPTPLVINSTPAQAVPADTLTLLAVGLGLIGFRLRRNNK